MTPLIRRATALGALRRIDGADPHHEIGGITEVAAGLSPAPALLFDRIEGFPAGHRIFSNAVTTPPRAALASPPISWRRPGSTMS